MADEILTGLREIAKAEAHPIGEALSKIRTDEGLTLEVDRAGADLEVAKTLGKGWGVGATARRYWDGAWEAAARLTWKPK